MACPPASVGNGRFSVNLNTAVPLLFYPSLLFHPIMCVMTAAVWPPARVVDVACTFHRPCETTPPPYAAGVSVGTFAHLTLLNPASTPAQVAGGKREGGRQQDRRLLLCRPPRLALSPLLAWLTLCALCSIMAGYPAADNGLGDSNVQGQTRKASRHMRHSEAPAPCPYLSPATHYQCAQQRMGSPKAPILHREKGMRQHTHMCV